MGERLAIRAAVTASIALAMTLGAASPVRAEGSLDSEMIGRINAERTARGLRALRIASVLEPPAERHTREMAARGDVWHSSDLEGQAPGWSLHENVGMGGSVRAIFSGFMSSPSHRASLLERSFTHLGVGAVEEDGIVYSTVILGARRVATTTVARETVRRSAPAPATASTARPTVARRKTAEPPPPAARLEQPAETVRMLLVLQSIAQDGRSASCSRDRAVSAR